MEAGTRVALEAANNEEQATEGMWDDPPCMANIEL